MSSIQQPAFDTVTEALQWLTQQGFTENFNLDENCIRYNNNTQTMSPEEFKIEYIFRLKEIQIREMKISFTELSLKSII